MKVLLIESHKAPVVAVQVWVKTGSADEKKKEEGISHFIEHLVFKGTKKYGVGEIARVVEGSGGELNAFTTFDHTVFHVTMSKNDLEVGLETLSEMMGCPTFDATEIDREREVVIEEIKRSFDNPHQMASQQLFSTVFKKHPYGVPIIGFERNIRDVSRKKLVQYYKSRYVPANMTLVVAGDFEKNKIKQEIANFYAGFEKNKLKKIKRAKEPKQKKIAFNYKTTEFKESILNVAFKIPGAKHEDVPVIDVLSLILGMGDSSRLVQKLRLERALVQSVSAGSFTPVDRGLFDIHINFRIENIKDIFEVLKSQFVQLLSEPVTLEELERAKRNLESDEVYSLETVDGLARKVGTFQTLLNDPTYIEKYLKQLHQLTTQDVFRAARKYFTSHNISLTLLLNKKDELKFSQKDLFEAGQDLIRSFQMAAKTRIKVKAERAKSPPIKVPLKLKAVHSDIQKHVLANGTKVILKVNPEIPLVTMKLGLLGGLRVEAEEQNGITNLLSSTWTGGTLARSEEEIAEVIENSASSLAAFGGRNSAGLTLETLKNYQDITQDIFADVITQSIFPEHVVRREAEVQMEHIKSRADNPSTIAVLKFMENIFAGHPYSKDLLGKSAFLERATPVEVKTYLSKMLNSQNAVFVATGDIDESKMLKFFEKISEAMPAGEKQNRVFDIGPLRENKKVYLKLEKEQSHIIVGYRGLSLTDPRRYALQVLQAILAGQGGRLFIELRDKASLAYTVSPIHMDGIETGYFGSYIGCSPEKGSRAVEMINLEFQKMIEKAPTQDEVERAKRYLIGQNHIGLQRNSAQANSILFDEIYGIDSHEAFHYDEFLKSVTAHDIHQLAGDLFQADSVTVAVGPQRPWNDV